MRTLRAFGLPLVLAHPLLGAIGFPASGTTAEGVVLVLRRGARTVVLGPADRGDRCGLGFVDDLLRLQLALRRLGWELHLGQVPPDVAELLDLVGLPGRPLPLDQAPRCGGRPSSSNRSR